MTMRERFRLTLVAIESLLSSTAVEFRFIFAHGSLPGWLDEAIERLSAAGRLERRRFETEFWPQEMRKALVGEIDTDYVVFVDNDLLFSRGWLERLVECADATGAGCVGPLYLLGDGVNPARVHMAGGELRTRKEEDGTVFEERHRHMDAEVGQVRDRLVRGPCDYLEFHCMLVRTALARQPGVLDETITCANEHIDVALELRARGAAAWFEPAAQVTYLGLVPHVLEDLPIMRRRWDLGALEASIAAFAGKWKFLADDRSFGGVRDYVREMRGRQDPLRLDASAGDRALPIAARDLPQTRSSLLELAAARGYREAELSFLLRAYRAAEALVDGGYRPCGRPFIQHLVGTAGVLMRYDFCVEVVAEGLLHAAYTHRRVPASEVAALLAQVHPLVEKRVRNYTQRAARERTQPAAACSIRDAEIAAIEAANEIDMRLSGEYAFSGRPPEISPEGAARLAQVLELLGLPGMALTLRSALADPHAVPGELVTGLHMSYRIGAGNERVPMVAVPAEAAPALERAAAPAARV